ncbi:MAG: hypothetical protein HN600_05045, partial [Bacteroidetes bacterium]|nr:hypothetical protein [Bacteroidota bacterium]
MKTLKISKLFTLLFAVTFLLSACGADNLSDIDRQETSSNSNNSDSNSDNNDDSINNNDNDDSNNDNDSNN